MSELTDNQLAAELKALDIDPALTLARRLWSLGYREDSFAAQSKKNHKYLRLVSEVHKNHVQNYLRDIERGVKKPWCPTLAPSLIWVKIYYMNIHEVSHENIDSAVANDLINAWFIHVDKKAADKKTPAQMYQENSEILAKETVLDMVAAGEKTLHFTNRKDDLARLTDGRLPQERIDFYKALVGYAYLWNIAMTVKIEEVPNVSATIKFTAEDWAPNQERNAGNFQWRQDYYKAKEAAAELAAAEAAEDESEGEELAPCPAAEVVE